MSTDPLHPPKEGTPLLESLFLTRLRPQGKGSDVSVTSAIGKKLVAEFIGTFFLTLAIALAAGQNKVFAPLAIGGTLMVMIFAFGHVSGANFNPAVSLGIAIRGKLGWKEALYYTIAQLVGSFAAGAVTEFLLLPNTFNLGFPSRPASVDAISAFLVEAIFTFALVTVVLNTATTKASEGNSFYGLAIGFTVFCGAVCAGGISGGAFNPAVGTSLPAIAGVGKDMWIYWAGPMSGGALAGFVFKFLTGEESEPSPLPPLARKLVAEFIGTFFLALSISLAAGQGTVLAPLAIGGTLMVMIFAFGHVSGANFNPAVSLGIAIRGKLGWIEALCYTVVQVAGTFVAGGIGSGVLGDFDACLIDGVPCTHGGYPSTSPRVGAGSAFLVEAIFTFALVTVVLNTATAKASEGNSFYGLAIGFTVFCGAVCAGGISGGAFNP